MSRTLTTAVNAALASDNVPGLLLVELDFASGALRVNNSAVTLPWNGHDWLGAGNLGTVETVTEHSDLQMTGIAMQLTGIPPTMISRVLGEQYQGRSCTVWFAPMNADYIVLADPVIIFIGRLDACDIALGETATVTLSAESRLTDWERPRVRRYTHEDQLAEYAGDKGLEFVPQMVEKTLVWGRS